MDNRSAPVISLGEWIITFIVLAIPLVNIIMLFVWGFSCGTNPSKQNFCRAALIIYAGLLRAVLPVRRHGVPRRDARDAAGRRDRGRSQCERVGIAPPFLLRGDHSGS